MMESKAFKYSKRKNPLFVIGATASGKTGLAVRLAKDFGAEIISADSRQVYRGMDVGTGKDLHIYANAGVRYHLIDIVEATAEFNLFAYQQEFVRAYGEIKSRARNVIVAGGSGLYLSAIVEGYDLPPASVDETLRNDLENLSLGQLTERLLVLKPKLHNKTDIADRTRTIRAIEIALASRRAIKANVIYAANPLLIGIYWQMDTLRERIAVRLQERLEQGLVEEVANLHASGISWERLDAFGLEYRYVSLFLRGEIPRAEMLKTLNIRIGQFAKRQMSWFRRMERHGKKIHWLTGDDYQQALKVVSKEWK